MTKQFSNESPQCKLMNKTTYGYSMFSTIEWHLHKIASSNKSHQILFILFITYSFDPFYSLLYANHFFSIRYLIKIIILTKADRQANCLPIIYIRIYIYICVSMQTKQLKLNDVHILCYALKSVFQIAKKEQYRGKLRWPFYSFLWWPWSSNHIAPDVKIFQRWQWQLKQNK